MEGIRLAAMFSSAPNSLGLCGPSGFDATDTARLSAQMKKFRAPYAYLSLIAKENSLQPFDYRVVEAFWLGNSLLNNVPRASLAKTITKKFTFKGGLSRKRAKALADALPEKVYPHHSFHVFYIGSISGYLEGKKKELDLCRISWGRVTRAGKGKITVCGKPVKFARNRAELVHRTSLSLPRPAHLPNLKTGDIVCSHWGVPITKISKAQEKNLEKFTKLNLALYSARPKAW